MIRFAASALALLLFVSSSAAQETKALADQTIRLIREAQNKDGTYGNSLIDTSKVLSALTRSPRRYNELDGPFFRRAAEHLVDVSAPDLPPASKVLALAGAISRPLVEARNRALENLLTDPRAYQSYEGLLALRTVQNIDVELKNWPWPSVEEGMPPETAVLVAPDPTSIAPPPTSEMENWTAWARSARLRGVTPKNLPDLPHIEEGNTLDELLAALEITIVCHGLTEPAPSTFSSPVVLSRAPAGRTTKVALESAWEFLDLQQTHGRFGIAGLGFDPGITALNITAILGLAEHLERPLPTWADEGLDYIVSLQGTDGAIWETGLKVYTTSVAIEALIKADRPQDRQVIERARDFLIVAQADEGEGYSSEADPHYGGVGYGGDERPDLSNTQMALEAVALTDVRTDHVFFEKALSFLERCQNNAETGTHQWPRDGGGWIQTGTDGGGTYMPGSSPAGEQPVGEGLYEARSYGSMTYALTKSYLLSGIDSTDPRVTAAIQWLGTHFTVEHNPGFTQPGQGGDGLYYYYMAMAKTLALIPNKRFTTPEGEVIPWQLTLGRHLVDEQRTDGSWINEQSARWWEGNPSLATGYAILALLETEP